MAIWLFFVELLATLLVYFIGYNAHIPSLTGLASVSGSLNNETINMASAGNYTLIQPTSNNNGGLFSLGSITGVFTTFINYVAKFFDFVFNFFLILGTGFYLIFYLLLIVIPSLMNSISLGAFGTILAFITGLEGIVISVYMFYLLTKIIGRVI